jgi:large subunit ribosomal protein L4
MTTLPIYDSQGVEVGSYELDPAELAPRINKQLLHEAVVMYQANRRQGTSRSKTRGEVAGSTKKMYRQKGTGNARAGHRRSGVRRGGGHIHPVRNRDYSYRMPKKAIRAATRMAIAAKIRSGALVIIDDLVFDQPRTREMFGILCALRLSGQSTLVTTAGYDPNVYKSARNIARVTVSPVAELNVLNVLTPQRVLVTKAALDVLCRRSDAGSAAEPHAQEVEV